MLQTGPSLPSATDVESVCADARREREAADASVETLREVRRQLTDATRRLEAATRDADRHAIADRKSVAAGTWREAMAAAPDEAARREATATWMQAVSEMNRRTRLALRQLTEGRTTLAGLEERLRQVDLAVAAARIRAETAEAACAEARARRADGEDRQTRAGAGRAVVGAEPGTSGAVAADPGPSGSPTPSAGGRPAVEAETVGRLLAGDRSVHEALAGELAEMSGDMPARYLLLLDTLVEEVSAAAVDAGELAFDHDHPLWGQFSQEEARLIVRGLRSLGFRLDLHEGWYGGRAPTANDLASALGFAGRDLRSLRGALPTAAELRALPRSVLVAPHDHLRRTAPDLTLDQVTRALGPRAARLGDLWDEWGRVRPLLTNGLSAPA